MEHQLNNPLRPSVKTVKSEVSTAPTPSALETKISKESPAKSITNPGSTSKLTAEIQTQPLPPSAQNRKDTSDVVQSSALKPEVRKALDDLNAPEELRKLMLQLTQNGIEIAGPKKTYIKHSYEIDQELHIRFHEMYPVLGFKKVKDAINDAIASWCDQHEAEFNRRNGNRK